MGTRTRIGIASLVKSRTGSVELPEEVTLYCPRCSTLASDKGQCILELGVIPDIEKGILEIKLYVDCRICGCYEEAPLLIPKKN